MICTIIPTMHSGCFLCLPRVTISVKSRKQIGCIIMHICGMKSVAADVIYWLSLPYLFYGLWGYLLSAVTHSGGLIIFCAMPDLLLTLKLLLSTCSPDRVGGGHLAGLFLPAPGKVTNCNLFHTHDMIWLFINHSCSTVGKEINFL